MDIVETRSGPSMLDPEGTGMAEKPGAMVFSNGELDTSLNAGVTEDANRGGDLHWGWVVGHS